MNEPSRLPWHSALYHQVLQLENELAECRAENARLLVSIAQLNARLVKARAWARTMSQNWKLRQQAWDRERAALLARRPGELL